MIREERSDTRDASDNPPNKLVCGIPECTKPAEHAFYYCRSHQIECDGEASRVANEIHSNQRFENCEGYQTELEYLRTKVVEIERIVSELREGAKEQLQNALTDRVHP